MKKKIIDEKKFTNEKFYTNEMKRKNKKKNYSCASLKRNCRVVKAYN